MEEAATSTPADAPSAQSAPPPVPLSAPQPAQGDLEDTTLSNRVISDDSDDASVASSTSASSSSRAPHLRLPASAAKASSAAFSIAASARSKLAQGGRRVLSPLSHAASNRSSKKEKQSSPAPSSAPTADMNTMPSSSDGSIDPITTMASAAGSLTSGLSSSFASASSSFGSLLFASQNSTVSTTDAEETGTGSDGPNAEEIAAAAAEAEAKAKAEAAERAETLRKVTTQQRMKLLEDLVQQRRSDWNYLKTMHEGSNYWLNVALLREEQMMQYLGEKQSIRRGSQFFYLGLGLGRLIGESTHSEFLAMECCQLLEELEFYFSSSTVQGMKLMVATSSALHEPVGEQQSGARYSANEPFRPVMHKWNQRPVYRHLLTPPIPFPLDYREVLLSLCDILALIYSKLVEDNSSSENLYLFQAIIRFDERIKKLFIDPVKKEFSAVALQVMAEEMRTVRKAYASGNHTTGHEVATGADAAE